MSFKYFPRHICMGLLIIVCIFPDPGHTQPLLANDIANTERALRAFTVSALPQSVLNKETHYDFAGSGIFAFSTLYYEQTGLDGYESSIIAGFGRHLLENENLRLDVNLGAGQRIVHARQNTSLIENPVARLNLRFTIHRGNSPLSLRQDLVIETERSSTASESMTTWSYAVNPRLALELTSAARKRSRNPSVDLLEVWHRTSFTLEWAF